MPQKQLLRQSASHVDRSQPSALLPASSVWQGVVTRHWLKPRKTHHLIWHHEESPCIRAWPWRALPTSAHPHHAASQTRPPRAGTGETGATQLMSKAVKGLPIVERCGSIVESKKQRLAKGFTIRSDSSITAAPASSAMVIRSVVSCTFSTGVVLKSVRASKG